MSVLVLVRDDRAIDLPQAKLPDGMTIELWSPRVFRLFPPGKRSLRFTAYSLMHFLGIFHTDEYALCLIRVGESVAHVSCVNPPDFRFPFMEGGDIQIGDIATKPKYRGRGLATAALLHIVKMKWRPERRFWYLVEPENAASIRIAQKVGFKVAGQATRHSIAGLPFVPRYEYHPFKDDSGDSSGDDS